ncbi:MAG: hypothetical protein M5U08_19500 [Burkholderiales bacterium]|nr:hypothetical protein [Burkholderiales bacterium]
MNHSAPASSSTIVCGLPPPEGVRCSRTVPLFGSSSPIVPLPWPVYQTVPFSSTSSPCGRAPAGRSHSVNVRDAVSKRAILLPCMTAM